MRYFTQFIACLIGSAALSFAAPVVSLQPGALNADSTFATGVAITGAADLYAIQFDLTYAGATAQPTAITEGSFLPSAGVTFFVPGTINNAAGRITATAETLLGPGPGASGDGVLANFNFRFVNYGSSALGLANVQLLDSRLLPIAATVVGATSPIYIPEPASAALMCGGVFLLTARTQRARRSRRS